MQSLLKTAAFAATLGLGALGAAQAATVTTTDSYTLGAGNYSVVETALVNATTATLTLVSGFGHLSLFANDVTVFNDFIGPGFSQTFAFASGTSLHATLSLTELFLFGAPSAEVSVTEFMTVPDPDPVVPLPATAPLLLGALGLAGAAMRRRKPV